MTTAEQRAAALDAANQVRIDRAKLRLRIGAGDVRASDVLAEWPECIRGAAVYTYLTWVPKTSTGKRASNGRSNAKTFALLRAANTPGHKRLDQLTPGQMERLTRVVAEYEQSKHPAERGLS